MRSANKVSLVLTGSFLGASLLLILFLGSSSMDSYSELLFIAVKNDSKIVIIRGQRSAGVQSNKSRGISLEETVW